MKRFVFAMILLLSNTACSGGGSGKTPGTNASGVVNLTPMGTAASPVSEQVQAGAFLLTATETGYSGNLTAGSIEGTCWAVQAPTTLSTPAQFIVAPSGLLCIGGFNGKVDQIKVSDSNGNSTITYIRAL